MSLTSSSSRTAQNFSSTMQMIRECGASVVITSNVATGEEMAATTLVDIASLGGGLLGAAAGSTMTQTYCSGLLSVILGCLQLSLMTRLRRNTGAESGRLLMIKLLLLLGVDRYVRAGGSLGPIVHPSHVIRNSEADAYSFDHHFGGSSMRRDRFILARVKRRLSSLFRKKTGLLG